jgi:probable phosphomutase (TIGR03848 family)
MTLVLIVRHGLTSSTGKALTGWMPGISLDDRGQAQAAAVAARLAQIPLAAIVSSPLERCVQTATVIAAGQPDDAQVQTEDRLGECKYGDWTGQPLRKLAKDPLWKVVQAHPSAVTFPGPEGEAMTAMQQRAVAAVRDWNARLGTEATYLICSHGDVIKAILADALGMHLDMSQRIQVDPCSLSVIRYTALRPFVLRMNDTGTDTASLAGLARKPAAGAKDADAQIGGGAGGNDAGPPHDGHSQDSGTGQDSGHGQDSGTGQDRGGGEGDGAGDAGGGAAVPAAAAGPGNAVHAVS